MSFESTSSGNHTHIETAAERLAQARHLIADLDGTLIREDEPVPGAAELLAQFRDRYVIVSNNSTHTAGGVARRLARMGLKVAPKRIVLAGEETVAFMNRSIRTRAFFRWRAPRCSVMHSQADACSSGPMPSSCCSASIRTSTARASTSSPTSCTAVRGWW